MESGRIRREALALLRDRTLSLPFPRFVYAEPTNACGLRCVMCPRQESGRPQGMMDPALFRRIADDCAREGPVDRLILHKDGEPLLHPGIVEMVDYAKRAGAAERVSFSTGGMELDAGKAEALIRAGLDWLDVAVDGTTAATYEGLRVRGDLGVVEENVRRLASLRRRLGSSTPRINLRIIRTGKALDEVPAFRARWEGVADSVEEREFKTWAGRYPESLRAEEDRRPARRTPCFSPFTALAVNWDGDVSLCSVDWAKRGVMGSLKAASLLDIWRGGVLAGARQAHQEGRWGHVPACATCADWQPFEELWELPDEL